MNVDHMPNDPCSREIMESRMLVMLLPSTLVSKGDRKKEMGWSNNFFASGKNLKDGKATASSLQCKTLYIQRATKTSGSSTNLSKGVTFPPKHDSFKV